MRNVYGEGPVMFRQSVYKWITLFNARKTETHNGEYLGHPSDLVNDETIVIIQMILSNDENYVEH